MADHIINGEEELAAEIDEIIGQGGDPEAAHAAEDELMKRYLRMYLHHDALSEFERLWSADFRRWYA